MSFVISQLSAMQTKEMTSDAEYALQLIMNELMACSRQTQTIVEEQNAMGRAYMQNHLDEEGQVDITAIEYVNSSAFTSQFEAKLKAIQTKEQFLNMRKSQIELRQKESSNLHDGWKKMVDKGVSFFKYGN